MVCSHGTCGIGNTNPFHGPRVMSRDGLPFESRNPADVQSLCRVNYSVRQNCAELSSLLDLHQEFYRRFHIAHLHHPGAGCHTQTTPYFYQIDTQVITDEFKPSDGIQISNA